MSSKLSHFICITGIVLIGLSLPGCKTKSDQSNLFDDEKNIRISGISLDKADSLFLFGFSNDAEALYQEYIRQNQKDQLKTSIANSRLNYMYFTINQPEKINLNFNTNLDSILINDAPPELLLLIGKKYKKKSTNNAAIKSLEAAKFKSKIDNNKECYARSLFEIGTFYRYNELLKDSAKYYLERALENTQSQWLQSLIHFEIANVNLTNRDYLIGFNHIEQSLQLMMASSNQTLLARMTAVKAKLQRKLNGNKDNLNAVLISLNQSIHNLKQASPLSIALLYQEICHIATQLKDHRLFFDTIDHLKSLRQEDVIINSILGNYYFSQNDAINTIKYYEDVFEKERIKLNPDLVLIKQCLHALTNSYKSLGDYYKAKKYGFQSMVFDTPYRDQKFDWKLLLHKDVIGEQLNFYNLNEYLKIVVEENWNSIHIDELKNALHCFYTIDSLVNQQVTVIEEDALLEFAKIEKDINSNSIKTSFMLYRATKDLEYLNAIWAFSERSKSNILYHDILINSDQYFNNVPDSIKNKIGSLKSQISQIKLQLNTTITPNKKIIDQLNTLLNKQANYYVYIKQSYPLYYQSLFDQEVPDLKTAQQLSDSTDAIILQYYDSKDLLYCLSISPNKSPELKVIEKDITFTKNLKKWIEIIQSPSIKKELNEVETFKNLGIKLFNKLIPAQVKDKKEILIIPDGILNQFPFGALVQSSNSKNELENFSQLNYLDKSFNIHYVPSFKITVLSNKKLTDQPNILAMSYSSKGLKSDNKLAELPSSWKELAYLKSIFHQENNSYFEGKLATREIFLTNINAGYDIIHLATHATSSNQEKLANKIIFRPNHHFDSLNIIYGYEIISKDINTFLVYLSSCESASGSEETGEGTYSLTRAFLQTGSNHVVSSLWQQADRSSYEIQKTFYDQLKVTKNVHQSLHQAKKAYLNEVNKLGAHPFYWAGVVSYGM